MSESPVFDQTFLSITLSDPAGEGTVECPDFEEWVVRFLSVYIRPTPSAMSAFVELNNVLLFAIVFDDDEVIRGFQELASPMFVPMIPGDVIKVSIGTDGAGTVDFIICGTAQGQRHIPSF